MTNYLKKTCFIVTLLAIISLFLLYCSYNQEKKYKIFRIIDHLTAEHVIESPLKNLEKKFAFISEDFSSNWSYCPELSNKLEETWIHSTTSPILGDPNSIYPNGRKLLKNSAEVVYSGTRSKKQESWRWIRTNEKINLRSKPGYSNKTQGIILKKGSHIEFEKLLPDGEIIIELFIVNNNWHDYRPKISISCDEEKIEDILVSRQKWFNIRYNSTLGEHTFEISFSDINKGNKDEFVIIGNIRIKSSSDIVLYSKTHTPKKTPPKGNMEFQYHRCDQLAPSQDQSELLNNRYLYNLKTQYPLYDPEIKSNPFYVKKKLTIDEYSYNSLLAPLRSEYSIPIKVPQQAFLEFKYGVLIPKHNHFESKIMFSVILKDSQKNTILFQKSLSSDTAKTVRTIKIDLTPYGNKKVTLSLITEGINYNQNSKINGIPFWVNPTVYPSSESNPPNIVLISLDTVRQDYLSCYGYNKQTSPATDKLAEDSALFFNTYSTTSWTLPAHISLLTALNCLHHQVYYPQEKMDAQTTTLADILHSHDYTSAAFTGGGYLSSAYGFSKGFDLYQEIKLRGNKAIRFDEAERLAELSVNWLKINSDKKFFLFLHTYQPHDPYANLSPVGKLFLDKNSKWKQLWMESLFEKNGRFNTPFLEKEKRNIIALYEGEIRYTDKIFVQPIINELKNLNLYDNTMIIVTSDHGEEFYDHSAWLHDHSLYNEAVKIPLIIKFPYSNHKGKKIDTITRITDIAPTILEQLHIKPKPYNFDGKTLFPVLENKEKNDRIYIADLALRQFRETPDLIATNYKDYKLILNKNTISPYVKANSEDFNQMKIELYDIKNDPGETKNLARISKNRNLCIKLIREIIAIYDKAKEGKKKKDEIVLDSSLEERLRALGYIK